MLAKYSAVPVLGSLGLFEILRVFVPNPAEKDATPHLGRRAWRLLTDVRPWLIVAGSLLLFCLVHAAVIARTMPGQLTLWSILTSGQGTLWNILTSWRDPKGGAGVVFPTDPWFELVAEMSTAVSPPLIGVALLGMVRAALMRTAFDLVCLAWFWVVLAALTFLVGHKEARYIFPVLPPLIYFIVTGLRDLWRGLVRLVRARVGEGLRSRRVPELLAGSLLLFFAAKPASLAAREFGRFYDPVYARPFLQEVARWTLARTSPGQSVLVNPGFIYTMYPADPIFSPYDEYFYFHHINVCALSYFLDRPVMQTDLLREVLTGSVPFVERFATGQVVLVSTSPFFDTTSGRLPEPPLPMILTFAGRRTLRRLDGGAPDHALYQAADHPQDRVVLARQDAAWEVVDGPTEAGWRFFQRRTAGGAVEPFERDAAIEPPARLELVRVEQRRVTFR